MMSFLCLITILLLFCSFFSILINNKNNNYGFNFSISFSLTILFISYIYYLSLVVNINIKYILIYCNIASVVLISVFLFKRKINIYKNYININNLLISSIGVLLLSLRISKHLHRWGDWDAFAIWIHHAKFLYHTDYWMCLFTNKLASTHPDYPLMLPSLIAFFWKSIGLVTPIVPIAISQLFFIAIPIIIFISISRYGYYYSAIISIIIFIIDKKFVQISASQYADTILSFFILLSFIIYNEWKIEKKSIFIFMLGFISASTAWIKNEGIMFFVIFSSVFLLFNYKNKIHFCKFLIGCAIPIIIVLHFKITLAPKNDLINAERGDDILIMLTDINRYLIIAKHFFITSIKYYWTSILLFFGLIIFKISVIRNFPFVVISLMLLGYFSIYVTTPNDLDWHLNSSLDRLFHHIFPSSIYLLLLKISSARSKLKIYY